MDSPLINRGRRCQWSVIKKAKAPKNAHILSIFLPLPLCVLMFIRAITRMPEHQHILLSLPLCVCGCLFELLLACLNINIFSYPFLSVCGCMFIRAITRMPEHQHIKDQTRERGILVTFTFLSRIQGIIFNNK